MRTFALFLSSLLAASSLPAGEIPRPSPELTIQRFQAAPIKLSDFRGKIVALAFIHTTCSHCQDLTRSLKTIQKDYAAKNVQVVTCAFEDGVGVNLPMYLKAFEPNFAAGMASDKVVKTYLNWNDLRDGIMMVPYMIFLDSKGVIRGDFNGKDGFFGQADKNIRAQLDKMTSPAAAKAAPKAAPKKK